MTISDEVRAQAIIGDDAEEFVQSELGRTVLGMAKQDLEAAIHEFDKAKVTDTERLMELKVEIRAAKRFEQYLVELITRGREALEAAKD